MNNHYYNLKTIQSGIYKKYNLPKDGWLKPCIKCEIITSKFKIVKFYNIYYKFYTCYKCKHNDQEISNYINNNNNLELLK